MFKSPQSLKIKLGFGLTTLGTFIKFDWMVINLSVQTLKPLIVIYRWGDFLYHHWEYASIYRALLWTDGQTK